MKELVAIFPVLRDWIAEFLSENKCMIASDIGHNMLIEQVGVCVETKQKLRFHTLELKSNTTIAVQVIHYANFFISKRFTMNKSLRVL